MLAFNNSQSSRRFNWVQTFFALQRSFEEKSYWLILYSSLNGAATPVPRPDWALPRKNGEIFHPKMSAVTHNMGACLLSTYSVICHVGFGI